MPANLPAEAKQKWHEASLARRPQEKIQKQGVTLDLTDEARSFLARAGYDPAFGARPLKRSIQKLITNPLANRILAGDFKKGDWIRVDVNENSLDFSLKSP